MSTKTIVVAVLIIAALLIGYSKMSDKSDVSSHAETVMEDKEVESAKQDVETVNEADDAKVAVNTAPDFQLPLLDGSTLTLSDHFKDKPIILDFWASWCPNCRRSMPKLSGFYDQYKDQIEVIGVNMRESLDAAKSYVDSAGITFPTVLDSKGSAVRDYNVRYTNTHVLLNRDGEIVDIVVGDITKEHIDMLIAIE